MHVEPFRINVAQRTLDDLRETLDDAEQTTRIVAGIVDTLASPKLEYVAARGDILLKLGRRHGQPAVATDALESLIFLHAQTL